MKKTLFYIIMIIVALTALYETIGSQNRMPQNQPVRANEYQMEKKAR